MNTTWPRPTLLDLVDAVAIPAGLAVATFLAATPWLHAFSVPGAAGLLVIAAIGSVSIPSLAIRVWRQPSVVSYAASVLGLLVLLVAAAGFHPHDLWHGLTTGPNRVLTETLPLTGRRALLAAPLVLTWLCGTASTELVSRSKRSNDGLAAIGLAVPVVCFVVAYAVSASRPGQDEIAAPLLLITLVAVALLRHLVGVAAAPRAVVGASVEAEGRPSPWRAGLVGGAVAAVIAVVLAVVVPSTPRMSGRPVSLNRMAPLTTAVVTDPVGAMAELRDGTPRGVVRTMMRVRTEQPSNGYLATVILDEYDGGLWSFEATFRPTGGRVPTPSAGAVSGESAAGVDTVGQQASLVAPLPVPFLPALNRAVDVAGLEVGVDAATGMLLPSHPVADPTSYSALSRSPLPTLATVSPADGIGAVPGQVLPAAGFVSESDLELPPGGASAIATPMRFLAAISGQRPAPTVAFLQAAMASLQAQERRVDPTLPPAMPPTSPRARGKSTRSVPAIVRPPVRGTRSSGTSLSVVINAVVNDRAATPEQFATLFAMVARYLGVPARLVTGFRLTPGSNGSSLPAGNYQVTSRQAWTWVEIPVAGLGWVVADPTPNTAVGEGSPPPATGVATPTTVPNQANAVPRSEIAGGHAVAKPVPVKVPSSESLPWWAVLLAVLGGVLVVAALLGPGLAGLRRVLRRRTRRRTDPSQLAVGAWLELLDALEQAGMDTGPGDTSGEVATEAGRHFGPDVTAPVEAVGGVADQAVFSVTSPPDREAAEAAWETQHEVRRAVHRGLDGRQRLRALLAVGSAPREPSGRSGTTPARFGP
jgi:hypothetical protein